MNFSERLVVELTFTLDKNNIKMLQVSLFLATLIHSGVWFMPNLSSSLTVAANPFATPELAEDGQYIFSSWLYHFLAYSLGADSPITLFIFGFLAAALFFFLTLDYIYRKVGLQFFLNAAVVFLLLPASFTAFYWVGMDGLTLLLMICAIRAAELRTASAFFGFCLGIQHFEMGFSAFALLLIASLLSKRKHEILSSFWILGSIAAGKIALELLFTYLNIEHKGRSEWLAGHLPELLEATLFSFPQILWSMFGFTWLVIVLAFREARPKLSFILPFALVVAFAFISADQTRTMAIVSFPLILSRIILNKDIYRKLPSFGLRTTVLLFVLSPIVWVWNGITYSSLIFYDLAIFIGRTLGGIAIPADPALWPFS